MPAKPRKLFSILTTFLLLPVTCSAFDSPLSDTAIREAYFLGQHTDRSRADFFEKYTRRFPSPKFGPYIESVAFLTPYALAVRNFSFQLNNYSAQQAQIDQRQQTEVVQIEVKIYGTPYGRPVLTSSNGAPVPIPGYRPRWRDFWRDFRLHAFQSGQLVIPKSADGEPILVCGKSGCIQIGAKLIFTYAPDSFSTDSITVHVDPPEGDPAIAEFDPTSFR